MYDAAMEFDIRKLREMHGISQNELAERLGVTQATVSRWESSGEVSRLGAKLLEGLGSQPVDGATPC